MLITETIDITSSDYAYDRLVSHINNLVAQTQADGRKQTLPNIIWMTKRQQKMLRRYLQMKQMLGTEQRYWLTPYNVMEVVVK